MGRDTLEQLTLFDTEEEVIIEEGEDTQTCTKCLKNLPLKFYSIKTILTKERGILSTVCSSCSNKEHKKQKERHACVSPPHDSYVCPICERNKEQIQSKTIAVYRESYKRLKERSRKTPWRLDHDHDTGKIRGWLCDKCNTSLGQLGDNIKSINKALQYLKGELDGSTGV